MSMSLSNDLEASLESSANTAKCRICWRTSYITDLLSPCVCMGSQKYVHFECLSRWIQERDSDNKEKCDVCRHNYQNITIKLKEKSFCQWIREGEDVIAQLFAIVIISAFFLYILNIGCIQFVISYNQINDVIRYIQLVLALFLGIVFTIGLVVALFVCRAQFKEWQTSHYTTIVETFSGSRRSTLSSLASTDSHSSTDTSVNHNEEENEEQVLSTNSKTQNQGYGSLC